MALTGLGHSSEMVPPKAEIGVTVIVPTLNRGHYLLAAINDLLLQIHRPLEILIVDQSTHETPALFDLLERYRELVTYHRVPFRGLPLARNFGSRHSRYDALVYVDDDIRCPPSFVSEHLKTLIEPGVGAVAGGIDEKVRYVPGELRTTRGFRRWTAAPAGAYADRAVYDVDAFKGCNFSIWRGPLNQVGGFDERLSTGAALYEDLELALRLRAKGFRIRFNGHARLTHLAAPEGGCRVPLPRAYVESLAHNRAVLVARHLRWFEFPTAAARLATLIGAYSRANRDPAILFHGLRGTLAGVIDGLRPPACQNNE